MPNLVSIITPMYNSEKTIQQMIESVLQQTYTNWELIIADDLSSDASVTIIEQYQQNDPRIKLIAAKINTGPAECRNRGISKAKGDYLAFLDSDDSWRPEKLSKQIDYMQKNNALLVYSSYAYMDEKGRLTGKTIQVPKTVIYHQLLKSNVIPCLTAIYNIKKLGKFYMKPIGHEDYLYWLTILKTGIIAHGLQDTLAQYRIHPNTISSNKLKVSQFQWKIYRKELKLGLLESLYYFSWYTILGFKKHVFTN